MIEKPPLPVWAAARAVAKCAVNTAVLTAQRRLHLSKNHVGEIVQFADGSRIARCRAGDRLAGPHGHGPARLMVT